MNDVILNGISAVIGIAVIIYTLIKIFTNKDGSGCNHDCHNCPFPKCGKED